MPDPTKIFDFALELILFYLNFGQLSFLVF